MGPTEADVLHVTKDLLLNDLRGVSDALLDNLARMQLLHHVQTRSTVECALDGKLLALHVHLLTQELAQLHHRLGPSQLGFGNHLPASVPAPPPDTATLIPHAPHALTQSEGADPAAGTSVQDHMLRAPSVARHHDEMPGQRLVVRGSEVRRKASDQPPTAQEIDAPANRSTAASAQVRPDKRHPHGWQSAVTAGGGLPVDQAELPAASGRAQPMARSKRAGMVVHRSLAATAAAAVSVSDAAAALQPALPGSKRARQAVAPSLPTHGDLEGQDTQQRLQQQASNASYLQHVKRTLQRHVEQQQQQQEAARHQHVQLQHMMQREALLLQGAGLQMTNPMSMAVMQGMRLGGHGLMGPLGMMGMHAGMDMDMALGMQAMGHMSIGGMNPMNMGVGVGGMGPMNMGMGMGGMGFINIGVPGMPQAMGVMDMGIGMNPAMSMDLSGLHMGLAMGGPSTGMGPADGLPHGSVMQLESATAGPEMGGMGAEVGVDGERQEMGDSEGQGDGFIAVLDLLPPLALQDLEEALLEGMPPVEAARFVAAAWGVDLGHLHLSRSHQGPALLHLPGQNAAVQQGEWVEAAGEEGWEVEEADGGAQGAGGMHRVHVSSSHPPRPGPRPPVALEAMSREVVLKEHDVLTRACIEQLSGAAPMWCVVLAVAASQRQQPFVTEVVDSEGLVVLFDEGRLNVQTLAVGWVGPVDVGAMFLEYGKPRLHDRESRARWASLFRPLAYLCALCHCGLAYEPYLWQRSTPCDWNPLPVLFAVEHMGKGHKLANGERAPMMQPTPPTQPITLTLITQLLSSAPWWTVVDYFDDSGSWRLLSRGSVSHHDAVAMARSGHLHPLTPILGTSEPLPPRTWVPTALFLPLDAAASMACGQGRYLPLSLADIQRLCADNRLLLVTPPAR